MSGGVELKALYTPAEVADLLGWPPQRVRRAIARGALPHVVVGGERYVPLSELQASPPVWDSILARQRILARAS